MGYGQGGWGRGAQLYPNELAAQVAALVVAIQQKDSSTGLSRLIDHGYRANEELGMHEGIDLAKL